MDDTFSIGAADGYVFLNWAGGVKQKQIIDVRSEFQQLEISFETMLKSKEKADVLMKQVVEFAAINKLTDLSMVQQRVYWRIINNGSISAHAPRPCLHPIQPLSTINGLTKSIALDGRPFNIACGQIDIGNAGTEMTIPMAAGILQPDGSKKVEPLMDVDHVGQTVLHMAQLPLESNILSMTIMATNMPFVGRG